MSTTEIDFADFKALLDAWIPVTVALNSLNRSMGLDDPYPFVLTSVIMRKLEFIHILIHHWANGQDALDAALSAYRYGTYA